MIAARRHRDRPARGTLVMGLILTGYVLILIDVTVVITALPKIQHDLHFSATSLSWVPNAYTLLFGGLLLLGARAGDILGRRRMFVYGIALFTASSLAVGMAQSAVWMIVARAFQGIGAAALAPSTLALLSTTFAEGPERTRAMAAYGGMSGIATSVGYVLGGIFTSWTSWRFAFFINVPVGVCAIIAAPAYLQETERHAGRFDIPGAVSSTVGISAIVYGVVRSATVGWTDGVTLAALIAGATLLAAFALRERRAEQPLLPLRLFASRERSGAYAARFLFNGALLSFFFFMTQYLQGVHGDSPIQAAIAFLPISLFAFLAATAIPKLTARLGNPRLVLLGIVALLIGTAWMSRVSPGTTYLLGIGLPMIAFGIGQGVGLSALTGAGMAKVAHRDAGVAGGVVNASHHLGGAVGLGILTTVFAASGGDLHGPQLLAQGVDAALTAAAALLLLAIVVALIGYSRRTTSRTLEHAQHPQDAIHTPIPVAARTCASGS